MYVLEVQDLCKTSSLTLSPSAILKFRSKFLKNEYCAQLYHAIKKAQLGGLLTNRWVV